MYLEEKKETQENGEERFISYIFLRQSRKQHSKLNTNIQNDFTTGNDW